MSHIAGRLFTVWATGEYFSEYDTILFVFHFFNFIWKRSVILQRFSNMAVLHFKSVGFFFLVPYFRSQPISKKRRHDSLHFCYWIYPRIYFGTLLKSIFRKFPIDLSVLCLQFWIFKWKAPEVALYCVFPIFLAHWRSFVEILTLRLLNLLTMYLHLRG